MHGTVHWARSAKTRSPYNQLESALLLQLLYHRVGEQTEQVALSALPLSQRANRARYKVPLNQLVQIAIVMPITTVRDSQFLTLVFNNSFISYCLDLPLCIIVTTTYSDIEPPSKSASLTSRLRNALTCQRPAIRSVLTRASPFKACIGYRS